MSRGRRRAARCSPRSRPSGLSPPISCGSRRCRRRCTCRTSTRTVLHGCAARTRRRASPRQRPVFWGTTLAQVAALARLRALGRPLGARVGGRAGRYRDAARDARLRARLGGELPFGVLDLWWQRRHELSNVGYVSYLFGDWFALGGEFLFLCFALAIVMGFARSWASAGGSRRRRCSSGSRCCSPSSARISRRRTGCADPAVARRRGALEASEHVGLVPIESRRCTTSRRAERRGDGLGPSRRVVLWDTLLDGRFTRPRSGS